MSGSVLPLTPETYDPAMATEEVERAAADPVEFARLQQVEEFNNLLRLELRGE